MDNQLKINKVQQFINQKVNGFVDCSVKDLKERLQPNRSITNKADLAVLTRKMMNVTSNEFVLPGGKASALLKSVRITGDGNPAESMSFQKINFDDWCGADTWQETQTYRFFKSTILALFIFQQYPLGQRVDDKDVIFKGVKVVKISEYDLNHGLKGIWSETRRLILKNKLVITKKINRSGNVVRSNNLPGISFNGIAHLRSGGRNGNDMVKLPNGQQIALQRFWLNSSYIKQLLGGTRFE